MLQSYYTIVLLIYAEAVLKSVSKKMTPVVVVYT